MGGGCFAVCRVRIAWVCVKDSKKGRLLTQPLDGLLCRSVGGKINKFWLVGCQNDMACVTFVKLKKYYQWCGKLEL